MGNISGAFRVIRTPDEATPRQPPRKYRPRHVPTNDDFQDRDEMEQADADTLGAYLAHAHREGWMKTHFAYLPMLAGLRGVSALEAWVVLNYLIDLTGMNARAATERRPHEDRDRWKFGPWIPLGVRRIRRDLALTEDKQKRLLGALAAGGWIFVELRGTGAVRRRVMVNVLKIERYMREQAAAECEPAALRSMPYADYLKTEHWKRKRKAALHAALHRCQLCNGKGPLNVHHRTYERRGEELPNDLIALCEPCHRKFHDIEPE